MQDPTDIASADLPLRFQGRLEEMDVVHIRRYVGVLLCRRSLRWSVGGATTLVAAGLIWWVLWWSLEWTSLVVAALFASAWVYLLFLLLSWDLRWTARRYYRKHQNEYLETQVSLAADRIAIDNKAEQSSFQWQSVGLVAVTPEGLLFCNRARQGLFWLPRRLFEGNALREQVLQLAARNGVPIRRFA